LLSSWLRRVEPPFLAARPAAWHLFHAVSHETRPASGTGAAGGMHRA